MPDQPLPNKASRPWSCQPRVAALVLPTTGRGLAFTKQRLPGGVDMLQRVKDIQSAASEREVKRDPFPNPLRAIGQDINRAVGTDSQPAGNHRPTSGECLVIF